MTVREQGRRTLFGERFAELFAEDAVVILDVKDSDLELESLAQCDEWASNGVVLEARRPNAVAAREAPLDVKVESLGGSRSQDDSLRTASAELCQATPQAADTPSNLFMPRRTTA